MILAWGLTGDSPFDAVCAALGRLGEAFLLVDQRKATSTGIDFSLGPAVNGTHEAAMKCVVDLDGTRIDLGDVRGVYWRTYDIRRVPSVSSAVDSGGSALRDVLSVEDVFMSWLELTDARVINRASAMMSNSSKPYQLEILRSHGFLVPRTLVTSDPDEALRFWTDCGSVIYKSVSGERSIVARLSQAHVSRIKDIATCPTQFQQYVPGQDFRVHVVADEVFATSVTSGADDYRYAGRDGAPAELQKANIPSDLADRCREVTRALGLSISGIDLRRAPDGRWFCFEANPSPGFSYYESHTGQPISDAIARLLASRA